MTTEENRRDFEEWALTQPWLKLRLARDKEDNYIDDQTEMAWEAWQAARTKQSK